MHYQYFPAVLFLWLLGFQVVAQKSPASYGETVSFKSAILGEERDIWIYKPPYYDTDNGNYPVLYLLDGELHFGHVAATVDYLSSALKIPQLIVVGIPNTDRIRDFTPLHSLVGLDGKPDSVLFGNSGGGDKFLSFIKDELVPFIDKKYRTQPYRILEGHSLGGMFASYLMQKAPDIFQSYIIISSAFYGANKQTLGGLANYLKASRSRSKVYIAVGTEPRIEPSVDSLVSIFTKNADPLRWQFKKYAQDEHISVGHQSIIDALRDIYKDWWIDTNNPEHLPSYSEISGHFKKLSRDFGYEIRPTEQVMANLGFVHLELRNFSEAIRVFQQNAINFPNSSGAYFCLGYGQMMAGKKEEAIKSFEHSLSIYPENEGSKNYLNELKKSK
jgi:predicted alpha/beta superfamily hydrolase